MRGATDTTDPVLEHKLPENTKAASSNLFVEDDDNSDAPDPIRYLAVATDDGDKVSLSLSGDDADAFNLVDLDGEEGTGRVHGLTFREAPNFESPTDANKDNTYSVKVVASDDAGNKSEAGVTVEVTNVDEPGTVKLSSIQPAVGTPLTAAVTDPDGDVTDVSWQWFSGPTSANAGADEIDDATSATYTPTAGDPADKDDNGDIGNYLQVRVTYNDAQGPDDRETTDTIEDQRTLTMPSANAVRELPETNAAPVFTERSVTREVAENTTAGGSVGDDPVKATDADEDVLTYSLSGGADKDAFGIDQASGQIKVGDDTKLDFEGTRKTYTVEVKAEDPFGKSDIVVVIITVTDVDEAPIVGLEPLNTAPKFAAATYTREGAENTAAGRGHRRPGCGHRRRGRRAHVLDERRRRGLPSPSAGRLGQIRTKDALDLRGEEPNRYTVTVTAADPAGLSDSATATITVTDVDEDPVVSGERRGRLRGEWRPAWLRPTRRPTPRAGTFPGPCRETTPATSRSAVPGCSRS